MTQESLASELRRMADTDQARAMLYIRWSEPTGEIDWHPVRSKATVADKLTEAAARIEALEKLLGEVHWTGRCYNDFAEFNHPPARPANSTPGFPDWIVDWGLMDRIRDSLGGADGLERFRPSSLSRTDEPPTPQQHVESE